MLDFLKKLFCLNHKYEAAQIIEATYKVNATVTLDYPITLLVCRKCGKRKVINDYSWLDTQRTLKFLKLWEKNQLDEIKQEFLTNERLNSNSPPRYLELGAEGRIEEAITAIWQHVGEAKTYEDERWRKD